MDELVPVALFVCLFLGLPWLILHYITRWKTAPTLTTGDEALLDELYQLARRLEDRMNTVERLIAADNPDFQPARLAHDRDEDEQPLRGVERLRQERKAR